MATVALRLLFACGIALFACALPASAGRTQPIPPLSLYYEVSQNNPASPESCINEDDYHMRQWGNGDPLQPFGYFTGTFVADEFFCDGSLVNGFPWDGGGTGVAANAVLIGQLDEFSVSGQDMFGTPASEQAVLVSTYITGKGSRKKTYSVYRVCLFPSGENVESHFPFGGNFRVTLRGDFSELQLGVVAEMFPTADAGHPFGACTVGQDPYP